MVDLPDKKGDTLFGKYRIIASLGKGGYSQVWLAEHVKLRCLRAVKVIRKDNFLYERLLNEANVLKMLNHQCIPTIYDIEEDEKCAYIIEEYCKGRSLKSEKRLVKHFHEKEIIEYVSQICNLIEYLHEGGRRILYLDMKPENLLINNGIIKLIDFGAAVYANDVKKMEFSLGTREYAAPEQLSDTRPDVRSDIYGIGKVMEFLMSDCDGVVNKKISKRLISIMKKCLEKDPGKRFKSVKDLRESIQNLSRYSKVRMAKRKLKCANSFRCISDKLICSSTKKHKIIGIAGSHSGAGVTHLAIMIGKCFAMHNMRTAIVELSDNPAFEFIKIQPEKTPQENVMYITLKSTDEVSNIISKDFDVIIIDFGVLCNNVLRTFSRCDVQLICTSVCEWKIHYLMELIERYRLDEKQKKWKFCVPYISTRDEDIMYKYYGIRVFSSGFVPDLDNISAHQIETLGKLIET